MRRSPVALTALCLLGLVALSGGALTGCAPNADAPYARWQTLESESGEYRFRYLAPPWELESNSGTSARLLIRTTAMEIVGRDASVSLSPKYELDVTLESGDPQARAQADQVAAVARGAEITSEVGELTTIEGAIGYSVSTYEPADDRTTRRVYLPHPRGAVRFAFEGFPVLDTGEVDAMVASLEVEPR